MRRRGSRLQRIIISGMALLMAVAFPVGMPRAFADTAPTSPAAPIAPTTPAPKPVYTYDPATGHWNTEDWVYDAKTGTYQPVIHTSTTPPPGATAPAPSATTTPTTSANPTGSTSATNTDTSATATTNAATNNTIGNAINGTSTSGNAGVTSNTTGGNATSGTAGASTTLTNIVNTATGGGANNPATFTTDVNGNVNGDLVLYPMIMSALLQAASNSPTTTNGSGTTNTTNASTTSNTNATTTNGVTNDVNLAANSGDATVANNTTGGNATTGNATAMGNIINMINSAIAAGSSFIGTINIYGNLNGNILVSPDFIPSLIASNANTATNATLSDTSNITNNVKLAATSGNAAVADNTTGGSATTGTAKTNVVLLNLTGHQVVAQNSLLVFVNVMGTWVGMIVDAAPGATSAALGTGVTTNTANTTNVNATTDTSITNNLTLAANSGDASVTHNTTGGNATSGNAMAGANILNISQSNIGLSGWFGILFINVFGSWLGSFGVDTPPHGSSSNPPQVSTSSNGPAASGAVPQAIQFVAHAAGTASVHPLSNGVANDAASNNDTSSNQVAVAGASDDQSGGGPTLPSNVTTIPTTIAQPLHVPMTAFTAGTVITVIALAGISLRRIYGAMTSAVLLATS